MSEYMEFYFPRKHRHAGGDPKRLGEDLASHWLKRIEHRYVGGNQTVGEVLPVDADAAFGPDADDEVQS
jgi:hypothetical protein